MPLNDTIAFWVSHNGLSESEVTDIADIDASDGSTVRYHRYYSSSTSTEVWLYEVLDGGHDWPGAFGNQDIDSSKLAWEFFSKYVTEQSQFMFSRHKLRSVLGMWCRLPVRLFVLTQPK